jgi:hypothetical protein
LLLVLAVFVLAGAAAAAGVLADRSAAGPFRPAAHSQARELLNQLVLPPDAQRLRVAPHGDGGLLHQPGSTVGARQFLDAHRIWRVRETVSGTASIIERHLPAGAHWAQRGSAGGPGVPYDNEEDAYSLPTSGSMSISRLSLDLVALPPGWTGIRADVQIGRCPCLHFGSAVTADR